MKNIKQNIFWNTFAGKYDSFIARYAKDTYEKSLRFIRDELDKSSEVLEVGTGTGIITYAIADCVKNIIAIDYAPEMIKIAESKLLETQHDHISFRVGDANNIDSDDKVFDVVIASNVIHLLPEPNKVLWEMHRVLKEGGKIILPTYCHGQNVKSKLFSAIISLSGFRAANRWSVSAFKKFVSNEGFSVQQEEIIAGKIPLLFLVAIKA